MPVVGSSAYNTAGQITSLVRSLLNDAQGNLFTDTVLLPYLNSAYRKVQRAIGNAGGGGFIQDDVLLVVTAVSGGRMPSVQVSHHGCHGAAESVADGFAGADEVVGAAERIQRRFCRDGGSDAARRIAVAGCRT